MNRRIFLVAVYVCLMVGVAPSAQADARVETAGGDSIEGEWIGGFRFFSEWTYIRARFGNDAGKPIATIAAPLHAGSATAASVRVTGDRVAIETPTRRGALRFEGKRNGDRIAGRVRAASADGQFELWRLADLQPGAFDRFVGDYELAPGRIILIMQLPAGPGYVDFSTRRIGQLFARPNGAFTAGPTMSAAFPVEITATFVTSPDGRVTGMRWTDRTGERLAPRITPYAISDVSIESNGLSLGGTLLTPPGPGPHPAIVMLQGSSAAPRQAYRVFGDVYARRGIAVLLFDKRGVGNSTGEMARATFDDLASDALAAVEYLKRRPEIDAAQIGLHGVSMGGWVAPLAASRSSDVAFVIMEAGPALTPGVHERARVEHELRADGFAPAAIGHALAYMDLKFKVGRTGEGWEALQSEAKRGVEEDWLGYVNAPSSLASLRWNAQHVFDYDPLPALERLTIPVLALYGELDPVVHPTLNVAPLERALQRSGNRDVTIKVLPKANHGFLEASTGGPREAARLSTFVPDYFDARTDWLLTRPNAVVALNRVAPTMDAAILASRPTAQ